MPPPPPPSTDIITSLEELRDLKKSLPSMRISLWTLKAVTVHEQVQDGAEIEVYSTHIHVLATGHYSWKNPGTNQTESADLRADANMRDALVALVSRTHAELARIRDTSSGGDDESAGALAVATAILEKAIGAATATSDNGEGPSTVAVHAPVDERSELTSGLIKVEKSYYVDKPVYYQFKLTLDDSFWPERSSSDSQGAGFGDWCSVGPDGILHRREHTWSPLWKPDVEQDSDRNPLVSRGM